MVDVLLGTEFQSSPGTNPGKRNGAEFVLRQFGVNCLQPHHPMLQRTPPTSTNHIPKWLVYDIVVALYQHHSLLLVAQTHIFCCKSGSIISFKGAKYAK